MTLPDDSTLPLPAALSGERFAALLMGVFVLTTLALGLLLWSIRHNDLRRAEIDGANLSAVLETRLDATLRRVDADLAQLASKLSPGDMRPAAAATQTDRINALLGAHEAKFQEVGGIFAFSAEGDLLYASRRTKRFSIADRPHFQRLRDDPGAGMLFSDAQLARSNGKMIMTALRAIRNTDGSLAGVVSTVIDLEYFQALLETIDLGPRGVIAIRRTDDTRLLLRRPAMPTLLNQPANYAIRDRIRSGEMVGVEHLDSPSDGLPRISVFRTLPHYPFYIVIAFAKDDVLANWRNESAITLAVAAGLMGLLAWLALWLRRSERRVRETAAALAQNARMLDIARQQAEAANIAKSRFLATMSHELRTPLNSVLGMAQLLEDPQVEAEQRVEFAREISSAGGALLKLLNDILDFAKIDTGKQMLQFMPCDLSALLADTRTRYAQAAKARGLEFETVASLSAGRRYASDPQCLQQMLDKLVDNAIKFTEHGSVRVEISELATVGDQALLEFAVADTGIGIAADVQARLFDPFFQVEDSSSRRFQGAGLGLSIVRGLAARLGGEVSVASESGQGTRIWFRIHAGIIDTA